MASRSRSYDHRLGNTGTLYRRLVGDTNSTVQVGENATCSDTVSQWNTANSLTIVKQDRQVGVLDGENYVGGVLQTKFTHYPCDYHPVPDPVLGQFPIPNSTELNNWAWKIKAKTNPSSSSFSIPTYVGELRDIPQLVNGWGQGLIHSVAKGYLSWRWAIAPLINELSTLWTLTDELNRRMLQLEKLSSGGYLKRRVRLGTASSQTVSATIAVQSAGAFVYAKRISDFMKKTWGSAQWKLSTDIGDENLWHTAREFRAIKGPGRRRIYDYLKFKGNSKEFKRLHKRSSPKLPIDKRYEWLAVDLALGLTEWELVETLWELTPWSWLVDWFFGLGTILKATNNSLGLECSKICYMRTLTSRTRYIPQPGGAAWVTLSGPYYEQEIRKERYPNLTPGIPVVLSAAPLFSASHWSIIGSLSAVKQVERSTFTNELLAKERELVRRRKGSVFNRDVRKRLQGLSKHMV